jgi:hypothetical protein
MRATILLLAAAFSGLGLVLPKAAEGQEALPYYLKDRGTGVPSSMFGTYIRKGEFLIYPFYEYYWDSNIEYEPNDFGYVGTQEYRGTYKAHEGLLFFGIGITDWLAFELEGAYIDATLTKAENDTSAVPNELKESGLGDVEAQLRWRWFKEHERRPELFSYFETVFPLQKDKVLIGTSDWEFKLGVGVIKGFRWGTLTARTAFAYDRAERKVEPGEYALEYLKRVSRLFRFVLMFEGEDDEVDFIVDTQWHFSPHVMLRLNSGFGLTSKATDFSPEVGVLFTIPLY